MSDQSTSFDLTGFNEFGVRAVLDGLGVIRGQVSRFDYDPASRRLAVDLTGEGVAAEVGRFLDGMRNVHRFTARKVIGGHAGTVRLDHSIDPELAASPDLHVMGPGLCSLRGGLLALFRYFEAEMRALADVFGAEDSHHPVMLPGALLAEMGYFGHFPHHVTCCCHFPDSLPVLEAVAAGADRPWPELAADYQARLTAPSHVLTPGVCLPCYPQQRGLRLAPGAVRTLTMQNHVFRYEAGNFRPLARGWDFTVRDIVFFGATADLEGLRRQVMDRTLAMCAALDLDVTLELANDPFFLDASRDKAVYQRLGDVKYELLASLPGRDGGLAISSFNLHRDYYTRLYDIGLEGGGGAESACMGFGLDRWLYAFVAQKGLDPQGWPRSVTTAIDAVTARQSRF
ncbi:MAG: hypothetical protein PW843_04005 [Azospirillaceae bacterium]|nr:hypothetical protein [Azospirillaceae bacterium]